jgi:hypothetical protein
MPLDCTMVMMPATMIDAVIMYSFVFWSFVLLAMMVAGVIRPGRQRSKRSQRELLAAWWRSEAAAHR